MTGQAWGSRWVGSVSLGYGLMDLCSKSGKTTEKDCGDHQKLRPAPSDTYFLWPWASHFSQRQDKEFGLHKITLQDHALTRPANVQRALQALSPTLTPTLWARDLLSASHYRWRCSSSERLSHLFNVTQWVNTAADVFTPSEFPGVLTCDQVTTVPC